MARRPVSASVHCGVGRPQDGSVSACRVALIVAAACAAVPSCSTRNLFLAGVPGAHTPLHVQSLVVRGEVLDATLVGEGITLRTFAPRTPECRAVLAPEASVDYVARGAWGELEGSGRACPAIGIGTLPLWRDKQPDPIGLDGTPVPREQASYRPVYSDESVIFLRGRFPLAGLLGWTGSDDTIAVVSHVPACQDVFTRRTASMQYYPNGEPVLGLVSGDTLCPIQGLVQPLDAP